MNRAQILFSFFLCLSSLCLGQQQILRKAEYMIQNEQWQSACPLLEEYLKQNREDVRAHLKLANCYLNLFQDKKALHLLENYQQMTAHLSFEFYYLRGLALQHEHRFKSAIKSFKLSGHKGILNPTIQKKILECELGIDFAKRKSQFSIENLGKGINSKENDLLPKVIADERTLFFSSYRSGGRHPMDVFKVEKEEGSWGKVKKLPEPIQTKLNEACVGISVDGSVLFLYRGENGGDLFVSKYANDRWSTPIPFPFNSSAKESSVTISPDGKEMVFVRKVRGKTAQLWYSTLAKDSTWSTPSKFILDTPYDEETPFFHADGNTIFFSSKGPKSMGGYDVLMSTRKGNSWEEPKNLGMPINSAKDEIGFVVTANGLKAFYSTVKKGGVGGQDIYEIALPKSFLNTQMLLVSGVVKSEGLLTISAIVEIEDLDTKETFQVIADNGSFLLALRKESEYAVRVVKNGFLFYSSHFKVSDTYQETELEIILRPAQKKQSITLNNVFFESGSSLISERSHSELNVLYQYLMNNEGVKILIIGHTDSVGDEEKNQLLSEERALMVKYYLIREGIDTSRIMSEGRGAKDPIAVNSSEEGRAKNRRIELNVVE